MTEVYANIRQKVWVDPKDVISKLIDKAIGTGNWVFEEDGGYYKGYEQSAGQHSFDEKEAITKDKYEYVQALKLVYENLCKPQQ